MLVTFSTLILPMSNWSCRIDCWHFFVYGWCFWWVAIWWRIRSYGLKEVSANALSGTPHPRVYHGEIGSVNAWNGKQWCAMNALDELIVDILSYYVYNNNIFTPNQAACRTIKRIRTMLPSLRGENCLSRDCGMTLLMRIVFHALVFT